MPSQVSVTYLDHSRETANVQLQTTNITAANFADQATALNDLLTAAADICNGVVNKRVTNIITPGSGAAPAAATAHREGKWLIGYTDSTATLAAGVDNPLYGKNFTVTLPVAAPTTDRLQSNSDMADLSDADMAAFVTAFEAFARSPSGGVPDVQYIKLVGRNI